MTNGAKMGYEFLKSKKKGDILYEAGYSSLMELELLEDPKWHTHPENGEGFEVTARNHQGEVYLAGYHMYDHYGPNLNDWPHYAGPIYKLDGTVVQN
jgi:hypothetical protein